MAALISPPASPMTPWRTLSSKDLYHLRLIIDIQFIPPNRLLSIFGHCGILRSPLLSNHRLRLQFSIDDETGTQDVTAFEDVAMHIIEKTTDDLFTLKRQDGNDAVLALLDNLIGMAFHFQIKIDKYNVTHQEQPLTILAATPAGSLSKRRRLTT